MFSKTRLSQSEAVFVCVVASAVQAEPRRRTLLKAGCAARAMVALPAALSLGIALARPADAQKAIGASGSGQNLNNGIYASYKAFTITSGTTITNTGIGVYGNGATLGNAGYVKSSGGNGIQLNGVSTVSNTGTILGGTGNGDYGVKLNNGPSTLNNNGVVSGWVGASANDDSTIYNGVNGTIGGQLIGVLQGQVNPVPSGTVLNKGLITVSGAGSQGGVVMQGGSFHNYAGGTIISNSVGLDTYNHAIDAENDGVIIANNGPGAAAYGVSFAAGGTITNTAGASIFGNTAGILLNSDNVTLDNQAGGTVSGGGFGVYVGVAGESFSNSGTISQTATSASQVTGLGSNFAAVYLKQGGTFTNAAGALINAAETGVWAEQAATVSNFGSIAGGAHNGVYLAAGGTISNFASGTISGSDAVALSTGGTLYNAGHLTGTNTGVYVGGGGGTLANAATGVITGGTKGVFYNGLAGNLTNAGSIVGIAGPGVAFNDGGSLVNQSGAKIAGTSSGVDIYGAAGTVTNAGSIAASTGPGVLLSNGGTVTNQSGGAISGVTGVSLAAGGAVDNSGAISGTGQGVAIGAGGGSLTNNAGGVISGGSKGVFYNGAVGHLTNAGTILSSAGSAVVLNDGGTVANQAGGNITGSAAGVNIYGSAGTVTNAGSIAATNGTGIALASGGSVNNAGAVSGSGDGMNLTGVVTVANTGTVNGGSGTGDYGVKINTGASTITNTGAIAGWVGVSANDGSTISNGVGGTIAGQQIGVLQGQVNDVPPGTVLNKGLIEVSGAGSQGAVVMQGGYFHNYAGGTLISNGIGLSNSAHTINAVNSGAIIANGGSGVAAYGISFSAGGTITNTDGGDIFGNTAGILLNNANVTISNQAGATLSGGGFGLYVSVAGETLSNSGTISQTASSAGQVTGLNSNFSAVYLKQGGTFTNNSGALIIGAETGVRLAAGGFFDNAASAAVSGATGVALADGGSVFNAGRITGTDTGISLAGAGASLTMTAASVISGGAKGVYYNGIAGDLTNIGTIISADGTAVAFNAGGAVTNQAGGTISGGAAGIGITGGAGTVTNDGNLNATGAGILLADGGSVTNTNAINGGSYGIEVNGAPGSIANTGSINATAGTGILLADGGVISNPDGKSISGTAFGIHTTGGTTGIDNFGSITASTGTGLAMAAGTLVNEASGFINGGAFGLSISGPGSVLNEGLISDAGIAGAAVGSGVDFTNASAGTVTGTTGLIFTGTGSTVFNAGTIASNDGGDAVSFSSEGVNFLTLTTGQLLVGTVDGGGSNSTIALDGTGSISNTITDFGATSFLDVATDADWTATGNWQIATATNDGTFQPGVIGTPLNLTGEFVQHPAGTFVVVVTPAATNQLLITGGATLAGAVNYAFAPGTYVPKTYPFVVTTSGVSGTFAAGQVYTNAPTNLLHTTTYTTDDANLVLYTPSTPPPITNGVPPAPVVVPPADSSIYSDQGQEIANAGQQANDALLNQANLSGTSAANGGYDGNYGYGAGYGTGYGFGYGYDGADGYGYGYGYPYDGSGPAAGAGAGAATGYGYPYYAGTDNGAGAAGAGYGYGYANQAANGGAGAGYGFGNGYPGSGGGAAGGAGNGAGTGYGTDYNYPASGTAGSTPGALGYGYGYPYPGANGSAYRVSSSDVGPKGPGGNGGAGNGGGVASGALCADENGTAPVTTNAGSGSPMVAAIGSLLCHAGGWIQAAGTDLNVDGQTDAAGYRAQSGGFLAGIDKAIDGKGLRLGIAAGYDEAWLADSAGGKAVIDTTRVGVYGSQRLGHFMLSGDLLYGYANSKISRPTGVGDASSSHGNNVFDGALQLGTAIRIDHFDLSPSAGIRFSSVNIEGFNETAGTGAQAFAVVGTGGAYTSVQPFVKLDLSRKLFTTSNVLLVPDVSVGYFYEAGDRGRAINLVSQDGTTFESAHIGYGGSSAQVGAGLSAGKGNWALYAHYLANLGGNWTEQTGEVGLRVRF
jgi:hypothetical protein